MKDFIKSTPGFIIILLLTFLLGILANNYTENLNTNNPTIIESNTNSININDEDIDCYLILIDATDKFMSAIINFDIDTLNDDHLTAIRQIHSEVSPYINDTLKPIINNFIEVKIKE